MNKRAVARTGNTLTMNNIIIKHFGTPDEIREFEKGRFELVELPNMTIGKATYDPGWKWSKDVSPLAHT